MRPIHCTHNGLPVWMNATVLFTTQLPFREQRKKRTKRWKMPPVTDWAPVSEVALLTLSRCVCSAMSRSPFTLLLCLLTSGVKYRAGFHSPLRLARSQTLFVFGAHVRESGCGRNAAMWEQPLTNCWNMGSSWQWKGGTCSVCPDPAGCSQQVINSAAPPAWNRLTVRFKVQIVSFCESWLQAQLDVLLFDSFRLVLRLWYGSVGPEKKN